MDISKELDSHLKKLKRSNKKHEKDFSFLHEDIHRCQTGIL